MYASQSAAGSPEAGSGRQFLHAYKLELQRYPDNKASTFVAPLATDLARWLEDHCPELWQTWLRIEQQEHRAGSVL
ncbi:MAG: hypothetical protein NVSMB44_00120 [Ktedonobacteraceae bacterium]